MEFAQETCNCPPSAHPTRPKTPPPPRPPPKKTPGPRKPLALPGQHCRMRGQRGVLAGEQGVLAAAKMGVSETAGGRNREKNKKGRGRTGRCLRSASRNARRSPGAGTDKS
eukprot:3596582-Rhodomonas_salina.2